MRDSVAGVLATCVMGLALAVMARSLHEQQGSIIEELGRIRRALERIPGSDRVRLEQLTGESLGAPDAPLTMIEYADLQCPFCRQFQATVFGEIKREYIDTGKLRYFVRDFPLESHPQAVPAARAVRCARDQGRFWEMRETILANNTPLDRELFLQFAEQLELDIGDFHRCVNDTERVDAAWQSDRVEGEAVGVSGTPTFLIGRGRLGGFDGVRISGMQPIHVFRARFDGLLEDASEQGANRGINRRQSD